MNAKRFFQVLFLAIMGTSISPPELKASLDNRGFNPFRDRSAAPRAESNDRGFSNVPDPFQQNDRQPRWEENAERTFHLPLGFARRFMGQGEWQGHQNRMQSMTPAQREFYKTDVRKTILERARGVSPYNPQKPPSPMDKSPSGRLDNGR